MNWWLFIKRYRFNISCILFEIQRPDFVWSNLMLANLAYRLHDLLCPEMWMIRIFPRYLDFGRINLKGVY